MPTIFEEAATRLDRELTPKELRFMMRRVIHNDADIITRIPDDLPESFRWTPELHLAYVVYEGIEAEEPEFQRAAAVILDVLTPGKE